MKKFDKRILILVVFFIFLMISVYNVKKENKKDETMTPEEYAEMIQNEINDSNRMKLSTMSERDRMEYYVSRFIGAVEDKNYEFAYSLLYDEFKQNYFPTLESFEIYARKELPSTFAMKYNNIERTGDYYVLFVTMSSALKTKDSPGREMNFVVKENDLNDFVISFSVN